jgi:hypothetical protein
VDSLVARRVEFLTATRTPPTPATYEVFVRARAAGRGRWARPALTEAVARYLFKLMAYKDEYEVARLHTDPAFQAKLAEQFEGDYKLRLHLAPPLFAKKNEKGELVKQQVRPLDAQGRLPCWRSSRACAARAGHLRPHRRAPHRARADRRVPGRCMQKLLAGLTPTTTRWRWRSRRCRSRSAVSAT